MPNRATSINWGWGLLALVCVLWGCPLRKGPRAWQGPDAGKVVRYTSSGIRVAQVYEGRAYAHLEVLVEKDAQVLAPGLEALVLEVALQGGTEALDGMAYGAALERAGAVVDVVSHETYVAVRMRCLPQHLGEAFGVLSGAFTAPRFPEALYVARRNAKVAQLREMGEVPQALADALVREAAFEGGIAGRSEVADPDLLAGVSHGMARAYLRDVLLLRCRMAVVVVGPVEPEDVGDALFNTLDQLPEGDCSGEVAEVGPKVGQVRALQSTEAIQALVGVVPAPGPESPAAFVAGVVMDMYGDWLRARLIADQGMLLEADARYVAGPVAHLRIDLAGPKVLPAVELALSELRRLREFGVTEGRLDSARAWLGAERMMGMESAQALAGQLGMAELCSGWVNYGNPDVRVGAVKAKHVQSVLEEYCHGISWGFVGDTTKMDRRTLLRF